MPTLIDTSSFLQGYTSIALYVINRIIAVGVAEISGTDSFTSALATYGAVWA